MEVVVVLALVVDVAWFAVPVHSGTCIAVVRLRWFDCARCLRLRDCCIALLATIGFGA